MTAIPLVIFIPFVLIASLMAFLIVWNGYQKHGFKGRRLFMEAFNAAIFTFIFFTAIAIAIGFLVRFTVN